MGLFWVFTVCNRVLVGGQNELNGPVECCTRKVVLTVREQVSFDGGCVGVREAAGDGINFPVSLWAMAWVRVR